MPNQNRDDRNKPRLDDNKIAIVGMSCLFPEAKDLASFWTNIVEGSDSIRDTTAAEWDPARFFKEQPTSFEDIYCKRGGFITEIASFDPLKHGVMPNSVFGSDPDQFLALHVASEALADAGYDKNLHPNNTHEVILGRTMTTGVGCMNMIQRGHTVKEVVNVVSALNPAFTAQQLLLIEEGLQASLYKCNSDTIPAVMPNVLAGRIAGRHGFKGRSLVLDAACASSLVAMEIAIRDLLSGQCDLALTGGLHVNSSAVFYQMFCSLGALSRREQIRPFDDKADGTILGEGLGMVVLKRLADARRDGDRIYAIICGIGTSSDGQGTSMLAPSAEGEALALSRAYEMANILPKSVELLEAHGTGTPSGDVVEMHAIEKVYGTAENHSAWCAIGSVKSMIGHCQAAAGVAGFIKTALSLYHRVLPPTLNVDTPLSQIDWSRSPCYINTKTRSWIHPKIHPKVPAEVRSQLTGEAGTDESSQRRAAVSAFGFGGVNAHVILEEYDDETESNRPSFIHQWETELCLFAAPTYGQLTENLQHVIGYLKANPESALRNVAYTLAKMSSAQPDRTELRLGIVAYSVADLVSKIESVLAVALESTSSLSLQDVFFNPKSEAAKGKLSFVLPGLGAAYPNMLSDLCLNFPDVRAVFDFVDELAARSGSEFVPSKKIFPRPFSPITESSGTLAAMDSAVVTVLMAEWALHLVLEQLGIRPDALLGCSTGEFAALGISGACDILTSASMFYRLSTKVAQSVPKDQLSELRSILVLADFDPIADAIKGIEDLYLSAALSSSQTILSGSQDAVAAALSILNDLEVHTVVLPTAIPYHTPLVNGFIDQDSNELTQIPLLPPSMPTWSCAQVAPYPSDLALLRRWTTELFTQPIQLKKTVEALYEDGVTIFVEVGPKGSLTPLISDILSNQPHVAVATDSAQGSSLTQLNRCLGELASHGVGMNLDYLFARRSCQSLNFGETANSRKSQTMTLDLQHPEVRLSPGTVEQVLALSPPVQQQNRPTAVASPQELADAETPVQESQQQTNNETVLETFLSNMADFHKNLMSVQEQVVSAYLTCQDSDTMPSDDQSLPLLRVGLVSSSINDGEAVAEVELNPATHRYLLDHAIGGPVSLSGPEPERVYLMPLTVALEMMCELASTLMPELMVVRMSEIRASRRIRVGWKGCTVKVTARKKDGNVVDACIDVIGKNPQSTNDSPSMQCRIHFDAQYAPAPQLTVPSDTSRSPRIGKQSLYTPQTMFHGPRMQSVIELESSGKKVTSASVAIRSANDWFANFDNPTFVLDPLLLDNATQPVLFHLFEINEDVSALLPFLAQSLDLYCDLTALRGFTAKVYASLLSVTSRGTEADVFLTDDANNLLAKFSSITSRRINLSSEWKSLIAGPAAAFIARPVAGLSPAIEPEGQSANQSAAVESLTTAMIRLAQLPEDEVTLNWCLDYVLNPTEFESYHALANFARKREWLAGRIAAKDAVRRLLANFGLHPCPCDVVIGQYESGQPFAHGEWAQLLKWVPLISISHKNHIVVATAGCSTTFSNIGIDVETVEIKDDGFEQLSCGAEELQLLNETQPQLRPVRLTQLWSAKEAAGKALGSGLSGDPRSLTAKLIETSGLHARFIVSKRNDPGMIRVDCVSHDGAVIALAFAQCARVDASR